MTKTFSAVLLDTVSIQRYIFSTNNLKENIGASQVVEEIFDSHLKEVIKDIFSLSDERFFTEWEKNPEKISILENSLPLEIGYIGGGNALIFFKDETKAKEFIKKWSMRLLIYCPGLIPACAIGKIDFQRFSEDLKILFKKLAHNKSEFIPQTIIKRHGITAECPNTGYSAEVWCEKLPAEKQNYISSVSNAKIEASERADDKLEKILKESGLSEKYTFTNILDRLGQSKHEESHIAIVHIDGNDMGSRFQSQKDLISLRKLSISVRHITLNCFKKLIRKIAENIENIKNEGINLQQAEKRTILPIRPIIIGGDDITFVSDGRLGVWLAKIFLEEFEREKPSDGKPLTACAGVAITKTKYPFYRGYRLCEELTGNAKKQRRNRKDDGSWIDFHIAYGGFSGNLEEIRNNFYKAPSVDSLLMRPYKISDLNELLKGISEFKEKKEDKNKFPRSKLMRLKEVLYYGEKEHENFLREINTRGLKLPSYKEFKGEKIVLNKTTPYFDMIELMEFYPDFALKGGSS